MFYSDEKGSLQFADVYNLAEEDSYQVEIRVRKRVLSLFKPRGILTEELSENIKSWKDSGGFSVNADLAIEESNRPGAERVIRYCARPAFSGEKFRLISEKAETADMTRLQYEVSKPSQKAESPLILTATELFRQSLPNSSTAAQTSPPLSWSFGTEFKRRAKVTHFANRYYRPDAAESSALPDEQEASKQPPAS